MIVSYLLTINCCLLHVMKNKISLTCFGYLSFGVLYNIFFFFCQPLEGNSSLDV